ncbi:MAG: dTMP kinase [Candidatus Eremiobacterota bacterium]
MTQGLFITFEGLEGAGKSTQAELLYKHLLREGYAVKFTREPGGTPIGEAVREVLLTTKHRDITPLCEVFLFAASRSQLVEQVIRPQLGEGAIVVCDRYYDATLAYQGWGRGVPPNQIRDINDMCSWGVRPDLTFLLDIEPARGLDRIRVRSIEAIQPIDRIESYDLAFHERVREGYLAIAQDEPGRFRVLDGSLDPVTLNEIVVRVTMKEVQKRLPDPRRLRYDTSGLQ